MKATRIAAGAVVGVIAALVALLGAEVAIRLIERYPLLMLHLQLRPLTTPAAEVARVREYVNTLAIANGVDRAWFDVNPERPTAPAQDPILASHLQGYESLGLPSLYEWNREYLEKLACERPKVYKEIYGAFTDVFVFDPLNPGQFPTFRFLRSAAYPSGLITNQFGWRGPGAALNKPTNTIRVVFVGASTTVGFHRDPFSYPEFIGRWLNLWAEARHLDVRFEVFNAGREGVNSRSIAEIVRQEVVPLEPDLVVYYEGSNQFWPASFIDWPGGKFPERPLRDPHTPWKLASYSLLAVRAHSWYEAWKGTGLELPKPPQPVHWPAELNEIDPSLDSRLLPVNLDVILPDLETMRTSLAASGGDLVISTFVWLVWDGMRLDPLRSGSIWSYLNETFWPFTYAHLRRMADFQNRVFAKYARVKGVDLIDFANAYPRDPALFGDAIHFTTPGIRLQAWVVLQKLIPLIERRIANGALPRPARTHLREHPAFARNARRLLPAGSFGINCTE